jgi:hypothetical protein
MMLAVLPWNSPVMPELRKITVSAPLVQLEAAWEELHPAICMIFRRSKGAVAVRETTPASAPLMNTAVADPPERSWLSHVAAILAVGFSGRCRPATWKLDQLPEFYRSGPVNARNTGMWVTLERGVSDF